MNNFTIELKHELPCYLEIYYALKNQMDLGILKSDEKMPSKRILAKNLGVSINTIMNAYALLLDEGYLYAIEKKGYYVSKQELITISKPVEIYPSIKLKSYHYDLTTQNNDLLKISKSSFQKTIKEVLNKDDFYTKTPLEGNLDLRKAISKHLLENRGLQVSYEQIIIGSGMEMLENLFPIINLDTYTLENPGYHKLASMLENKGYKIEYLSLDKEGILLPAKPCVLYTTPFNQFPTGVKMSIRRKKELIQWANQNDSYIIEDDFDAEFRISGAPTTALYTLDPNRVIFFSTFSTTLFSGIKMAYMILSKPLLKAYQERYQAYSNPVSSLNQQILYHFITSGAYARHINRLKHQLQIKRNTIIEMLKECPNIKLDTKRNFLSIIIKINTSKDIKALLEESSVKIQSISDYDIYKNQTNEYLIGYTNIDNSSLIEALEIIKEKAQ